MKNFLDKYQDDNDKAFEEMANKMFPSRRSRLKELWYWFDNKMTQAAWAMLAVGFLTFLTIIILLLIYGF